MAGNIKGITIELDGDSTKLSKALQGVNKDLKETQSKLKDVEKALKFDPKNVDLLQQKQKYLGQAIDDTKEKLEKEKQALEELNKRSAAGEDVTDQQEALQREIVETEGSLKSLQAQSDETGKALAGDFKEAQEEVKTLGEKVEDAGEKIKNIGSNMKDAGDKISSVGDSIDQNVSQPLRDLASKSVDAWHEVDDALDTVTTKTGASGEALSDMQDRAKSIATTIPASFQEAGDAVGEVNTRFGLTGDALEDLSTDFIKFAQLNDTDVSSSIDSVQAAMAAMNVDTKDASSFLGVLNKAGQDTGVNVNTLADSITKNGAALNDMGYSASDAAFFLANLDKNGVDTSTTITGLKTAFKNSAKQGKSMSETLSDFSDVMSSGKPETEKMQAAIDTFGSKAGAAIYQYCSEGKLNFEDLNTVMSDYSDNVNDTWTETQDPLDQMTVVQNNLKDVGSELVETAGPMLVDIMQEIIPIIKDLKDGWDSLPDGMQQFIVQAGLVAMAAGPVVSGIGKVTGGLGSLAEGIGGGIEWFGKLIGKSSETSGALEGVATGGGSKLTSFLTSDVSDACSTMSGTLGTAGAVVGTFAATFEFTQAILQITGLEDKLSELGEKIYDDMHQADENIANTSNNAIMHAQEAIQGNYDVQTAVSELDQAISVTSGNEQASLQKLRDAMVQKYGEGATASTNAATTIDGSTKNTQTSMSNLASTVNSKTSAMNSDVSGSASSISSSTSQMSRSLSDTSSKAKSSFSKIGSAASGAESDVASAMSSAKGDVRSGVGAMESTIRGANFSFPHIKLPHFSVTGHLSIDPPSIPKLSISWYKKAYDDAYILNDPTIFGASNGRLLGGGEGNGSEAVVGTDKLVEIVQTALQGVSGGTTVIPVYIGQERIEEIVVKATNNSNFRSGGR